MTPVRKISDQMIEYFTDPIFTEELKRQLVLPLIAVIGVGTAFLVSIPAAHADVLLPGEDISAKMEVVGSLLKFLDTALFNWGSKLLGGFFVYVAAHAIGNLKFGRCGAAVVASLLFFFAPNLVRNAANASGSNSVFQSQNDIRSIYIAEMLVPETRIIGARS